MLALRKPWNGSSKAAVPLPKFSLSRGIIG